MRQTAPVATVIFLHGIGGLTPGWSEALESSVTRAGGPTDFTVEEVDFADLLGQSGVIRRRHVEGLYEPHESDGDRAAQQSAYRGRQRDLRAFLWDSPDRVAGPDGAPPVFIPGEIMVRLPILGMREAGHYRHDGDVKAAIVERVAQCVTAAQGPVVLLAHSLGSVVAMDALHMRDISVDLLLTIGSPLGVPDFWAKQWQHSDTFPYDRVGGWVNVVNRPDPVVWGRGARERFPEALDVFVDVGGGLIGNGNFHDAATYASTQVVGSAVAYAFSGSLANGCGKPKHGGHTVAHSVEHGQTD